MLLSAGVVGCNGSEARHTHNHGEHGGEEVAVEKGPHGGRHLSDGAFSLELQIFEKGTPPQFRAYAFEGDTQLSPSDFSVGVTLTRLGGVTESFEFLPIADFRNSDKEVVEPHSFDVEVAAEWRGKKHSWSYQSYEGRTDIADDVAQRAGIKTALAGAHTISTSVHARGKILPSEDRIAHVIPRFSGVVREGRKHIGDKVEKGEVMAIIESNQNLQPFEVRSQIPGTVINGHLIVGEFVPENEWVYIIADLSEVWADFYVSLQDSNSIAPGHSVVVSSANGDRVATGKVSYVAPYADERSQTQLVRVVLPNLKNEFLPGMFVTADIVTEQREVPVAVPKRALQRFRDWEVVFAKSGTTYEIRPLTIGKRDREWIEVVEGVTPGTEYVTDNAFLIKADILKSGASHDH
jgi:cobalt-zinc-cadmium efflux system membrane fusion protein